MAALDPFTEFVVEQLSIIGPVRARSMFGGVGLYADDVMFALIAFETLYLKADETTSPRFEAEDCQPFTYEGKGKPVRMSYWQAPEFLFEDPDAMRDWAGQALSVARAAIKAKKPRKTAKTTSRSLSGKVS